MGNGFALGGVALADLDDTHPAASHLKCGGVLTPILNNPPGLVLFQLSWEIIEN